MAFHPRSPFYSPQSALKAGDKIDVCKKFQKYGSYKLYMQEFRDQRANSVDPDEVAHKDFCA